MHKILLSIREILQFFPKWKKVVDVRKKYVIIICSAIKIPNSRMMHNIGLEGRLGVRLCQM